MKQLSFFILLLVTAGTIQAQNAKDLAVAFMQRYTELANGSYKQLYADKLSTKDTIVQFDVPNITAADHTILNWNPDEVEYVLTYNRNNPLCVKTGKEIIKAMQILAKNKGFELFTTDADFYALYKGSEEIMTYWHEQYVNIYPNEYLHFHIAAATPFKHYLADETVGKPFPPRPTNTTAAQIIEVPDDANKRTLMMNGLFVKNKLTKGYIRLSGYGPFFDGTWLSRKWDYDGKDSTPVHFVPAATNDTIQGQAFGLDFSTFTADYRYFKGGLKIAKNSVPWLLNQYQPYYEERELKKQKDYEAEDLKKHSVSYEEAQRNIEINQRKAVQGSNSATPTSGGATQTYSSFSKCTVCNGVGYTEYDCGQGGGHPCRKYCTPCNGTGQVHN
ncbi:hypothetical protein [Flavobacterium sp. N1994]|uniref:hypothetical protein n=1 Tax=Flavobacterium sp. N1994 TaxID=2986827 RepID=UPI002222001C|nr:hypothetical protein [Flavobacterium sp. N1994]